MKSSLHTHSTYCDGKDTLEEMTLLAIEKGFDTLGFSGHAPCIWDFCGIKDLNTYRNEINHLKEKYKDQIQLLLGIEEDISDPIEDVELYDYIIGSVHMLPYHDRYIPLDSSRELFENILHDSFHDDFLVMCRCYYSEVKKIKDCKEVDIIGHLDLITKYNELAHYIAFDHVEYLAIAKECIDYLGTEKIYEVNTGAIARGYRTTPYPDFNLLVYLKEKGAKIMLNSDCHDKNYLDCYYPESIELIKQAGFKEIWVFQNHQFVPVSIEEFN